MTPSSSANLEQFLSNYRVHGKYFLVPAVMNLEPEMEMTYFLGKTHLHVRSAWEISENDPDLSVLDVDDDPIIPENVVDAPVKKALERIRAKRGGLK